MKVLYLKYGLTALMMAFAMTLCFSCSSDDDEETPGEKKESKEEQKDTFKGDGKINGHDYVVLAGYKWATENVGAVYGVEAKAGPAAEDNVWGCYYYTQENAKKAAESCGGTWKHPSEAQWQKLLDECDWRWKKGYSYGGKTMKGYIVSDKKNASKFIFLPAAGICIVGYNDVDDQGDIGYYWSSDDERCLDFDNGSRSMYGGRYPSNGFTVRPVSE